MNGAPDDGAPRAADPWAQVTAEGLARPEVAELALGRGVSVAIVDTGVSFDHPHLALPPRGFAVEREEGELVAIPGAVRDAYGHGTCCAALVHLLAPGADLFAVRVTGARATTDADRLARGIEEAALAGAVIIAVALGTETALRAMLDDAVLRALELGAVVVAPDPDLVAVGMGPVRAMGPDRRARPILPAGSPGALAVGHADAMDVRRRGEFVLAEGRARPALGHVRNFFGPSLSTARTAAALARYAEGRSDRGLDLVGGFKKALDVL